MEVMDQAYNVKGASGGYLDQLDSVIAEYERLTHVLSDRLSAVMVDRELAMPADAPEPAPENRLDSTVRELNRLNGRLDRIISQVRL